MTICHDVIAPQIKSFGPQKIQIIQGLKSAILAIFQKELGCAFKNPSLDLKKILLFWVPMNFYAGRKN